MFLQILFIFFLIAFSLGELTRLPLGFDAFVTLVDIAVFCVVGFWFLLKLATYTAVKSTFTKPLFLFVFVCILSLVVNSGRYQTQEIIVASLYTLRFLVYAGLFFVVREFDKQFKNRIMHSMTAVGSIIVGLGYIQYFLYPDLRNLYYAGWDEHLYRMFSTFLDPNFAGTFFVLYLLFLLGLFWNAYKEKKYGKVQIYGGLLVLTFCAILLTFSRSAFIMLAVAMTIFLIQIKRTRLLLGIAVISVIFLGLISRSLQSEGTNLLRTASNVARLESAKRATTIFLDNPVFGVGFNAYRYAQSKYGFTTKNKYEDHAGAGTDNSFLFILATTGIVGFGAYLYLLFTIVNKSYNNNLVLFCSILGLLVNAFFINSLFYPFIMAWVFILLGIIEKT